MAPPDPHKPPGASRTAANEVAELLTLAMQLRAKDLGDAEVERALRNRHEELGGLLNEADLRVLVGAAKAKDRPAPAGRQGATRDGCPQCRQSESESVTIHSGPPVSENVTQRYPKISKDPPHTPPGGGPVGQEAQKRKGRGDLDARLPCDLPLGDYVARAVEEHHQHAVEGRSDRECPLWHFIRLLKRHRRLGCLGASGAFTEVNRIVAGWRVKRKRPPDPWQHWLGVRGADAAPEFLDSWDKVRLCPGEEPLRGAVERNRRERVRLERLRLAGRVRRWTAEYETFVGVAGWLQVVAGNRTILLPVGDLAELLGVEKMTISRYRRWAVEDGLLREVRPAGGPGRAAEFWFNVATCPALLEAAEPGTAERF